MKNLLFFLLLLSIFFSGCSNQQSTSQSSTSQQNIPPKILLIKEKEDQRDYGAVVDLAIGELNNCGKQLSDGCLAYLNFLWLDGTMLLYELDSLGDYELFGARAKQLVEFNENHPNYRRLIREMIQSRNPLLAGKDENNLVKLRNNLFGHLAIFYALSGQADLARKYLNELEREASTETNYIRNILNDLELIHADKDKKALAQALLYMRMPLSFTAANVDVFWPVFKAFRMPNINNVNVDEFPRFHQDFLNDLKAIHEAIYTTVKSYGLDLYWSIAGSEDQRLIKELYPDLNSISIKHPLFNIFQCSFASVIGNIIARSKGLDMRVIVTQDKSTLERLRKTQEQPTTGIQYDSLEESGRPNHVLNLLKISDSSYIFVDFLNCWVSEPFNIGDVYIKQGNFYELITWDRSDLYEHFISVEDSMLRGVLYQVLAVALYESGHKEQSYFLFKKALYFWPDCFQSYFFLSDNVSKEEKRENDLACNKDLLDKSLQIYPKNPDVYVRLGFYYYAGKDYIKSAEAFEKATKLDLGDYLATYMLGEAYISAGKFQDAVQSFQKSIALSPSRAPQSYKGIGRAYLLMHDSVRAKQALRKSLELYESRGDAQGAEEVRKFLQG